MAKSAKYRKEKANQDTVPLYLGEVVAIFDGSLSPPPDPPTQDGETSSPTRRTLNPLFVEWMHGWPIGLTDCEQPVMGLVHWQRLMRGQLSRLVSIVSIDRSLFD